MDPPRANLEQALEMLQADLPADRWEAVRALEHQAAKRGAIDANVVDPTVQRLADDDWNVRAAAQRLFDQLAQEPRICRQLLHSYNHPDPTHRLAVVSAIRSVKDKPEVRRLLSAALTDPDDEVAEMADYVFWHPVDGADHPRVPPPGWAERMAQLHATDRRADYRENLPFFVYGTLRHGEINYGGLLRGQTLLERPAQMENQAMYTPGLAFVVDSPFDRVVGDLMWVADEDFRDVARGLDRLEGFSPGQPHSSWGYRRVARPVLAHNGGGEPYMTRAWVYQGVGEAGRNRSWTAQTFRPTGDWLDRPDNGWSSLHKRRER